MGERGQLAVRALGLPLNLKSQLAPELSSVTCKVPARADI